MRTTSIVLLGAARYITKWLPRRPRRATWSVRRPAMISSRALGAGDIGTLGEFANRPNKGVPIDARLSRAEILSGPFEDVGKVDFRRSAETNAPFPLGHEGSIRRFGR